jgi:hypothetical protein
VPVVAVTGGPGQRIDLRIPVAPGTSVGDALPLWMQPVAGADSRIGLVGRAVFDGASLHITGTIPTVMAMTASPRGRAMPATAVATTVGDYVVHLGFARIDIRVERDAAPYRPEITMPATRPSEQRVLHGDAFAGIALGSPGDVAVASLVALLGPPMRETDWSRSCAAEVRAVEWSDLRVELRRVDPSGPGVFVSYVHSAITPGSPARFATVRDVVLGSTVADLRGAEPRGSFVSTGLGGDPPFSGWIVADSQLVVFLDGDFLEPGSRVRAIGAPRDALLADC